MDTISHMMKKAGEVLCLLGVAFLFFAAYGPNRWLPWNWKYTDKQWESREKSEARARLYEDPDGQYDGYRGRP